MIFFNVKNTDKPVYYVK